MLGRHRDPLTAPDVRSLLPLVVRWWSGCVDTLVHIPVRKEAGSPAHYRRILIRFQPSSTLISPNGRVLPGTPSAGKGHRARSFRSSDRGESAGSETVWDMACDTSCESAVASS